MAHANWLKEESGTNTIAYTIKVPNESDEHYASPTGVHFTYQPFVIMLGLGAALALISSVMKSRRRREEE